MIHSKFRFKWFVFKYIYNPRLLLYFLAFTKLDMFDLCSSGAHGLWRSVVWPDHRYVPNWNVSTTFGWLVIQPFTEIHGPQRMNPTDGSKPLTYHLTPPASRCFHLSGESSTSVRNLAELGKYTMVANSQCSATMCLIFVDQTQKNLAQTFMSFPTWIVRTYCHRQVIWIRLVVSDQLPSALAAFSTD